MTLHLSCKDHLIPLLFHGYTNHFTKILIYNSIPILRADNSAFTTHANILDFQSSIKAMFI
jgi:hypothetical protein